MEHKDNAWRPSLPPSDTFLEEIFKKDIAKTGGNN